MEATWLAKKLAAARPEMEREPAAAGQEVSPAGGAPGRWWP